MAVLPGLGTLLTRVNRGEMTDADSSWGKIWVLSSVVETRKLSHHLGMPPVPWPCHRVCLSICSLQEEGGWFGAPPGGLSAAGICGLGSGHWWSPVTLSSWTQDPEPSSPVLCPPCYPKQCPESRSPSVTRITTAATKGKGGKHQEIKLLQPLSLGRELGWR